MTTTSAPEVDKQEGTADCSQHPRVYWTAECTLDTNVHYVCRWFDKVKGQLVQNLHCLAEEASRSASRQSR